MSDKVQVQLDGKTYSLSSDDPAEHVLECAALVNRRIAELRDKGAPDSVVGLFAAMTIADELLKQRKATAGTNEALLQHLTALRKAAG